MNSYNGRYWYEAKHMVISILPLIYIMVIVSSCVKIMSFYIKCMHLLVYMNDCILTLQGANSIKYFEA